MRTTNYYLVRLEICGYPHTVYCSAKNECHAVQVAINVLLSQGFSLEDIRYDRTDGRCYCEPIIIYKYTNY